MSLFGLIKRSKPSRAVPAGPVMRELPQPPQQPPRPVPSSGELRQMLFDAIAQGDEPRLFALCREHRDFVNEYAEVWMIVPDDLLANPAAAEWYRRGVEQLTRLCRAAPDMAAA